MEVSENRPRALRVSALPAGILLLLSLIFLGISVLFIPPVWTGLHGVVMKDGNAGDAGRIVTAMWSGKPFHLVSSQLKVGELGTRETAHYDDVREGFRFLLGGTIVLLGVLLSVYRMIPWRAATRWSLVLLVGVAVIGGTWALVSWRHFFQTLHWWVFQDRSWLLPMDSPSLVLFPYPIWQWAFGLLMGVILLVHLILLGLTSFARR